MAHKDARSSTRKVPLTSQELLKVTPRAGLKENPNFLRFQSSLAALRLLSAAELEERWKEVEERNAEKIRQGLPVSPYNRR